MRLACYALGAVCCWTVAAVDGALHVCRGLVLVLQ